MRIAVSAGHNVFYRNIFDNGATTRGYKEAAIVRQTVKEAISLLKKQGHQVLDVTPYDTEQGNPTKAHRARADRVNAFNPDIYLDLHMNSGGGTGPEVYIHSGNSLAYPIARKIVNNLANDLGLRNRGVKVRPGLMSLYMPKAPAVLIEGAFLDSPGDVDMKSLTPKKYAQAVAKSFGKITQEIEIQEIYRVRKEWKDSKSQKGAYSVLDNGIDEAKKNPGYKVFDGGGNQVYPTKEEKTQEISSWAKDGVNYVRENKIMTNDDEGNFNPKDNVTREELATVIHRATDIKK